MLPNAVRGVSFPGKKRYEDVQFNVISITRGWVGVKVPGKKRYVTLECPPPDTVHPIIKAGCLHQPYS